MVTPDDEVAPVDVVVDDEVAERAEVEVAFVEQSIVTTVAPGEWALNRLLEPEMDSLTSCDWHLDEFGRESAKDAPWLG